jgi:hypothetical protein
MANKLTERFDRDKQAEGKRDPGYGEPVPDSPGTTTTPEPAKPAKRTVVEAGADNQARIARGEAPDSSNVEDDDPHSGPGASPKVDELAEQFPADRVQNVGTLTPNAVMAAPTPQDVSAPTPAKTTTTTAEPKAVEPKP